MTHIGVSRCRPRTVRRLAGAALAVVLAGLIGCTPQPPPRTVVFAAASLAPVLSDLVTEGRSVTFSFDGSSGLVDALAGGARADVLATADAETMQRAVAAGLSAGDPVRFASNVLVLVTPPGNPAGITGLDDSLAGSKLVTCAPEVPCGRAAAAVADGLGVRLAPVSEEARVTDVLGKVASGEADAGLVYATDAAVAGGDVLVLDIPGAESHPVEYWIAPVAGGSGEAAAAFIAAVTSDEGQALLAAHGFGPR